MDKEIIYKHIKELYRATEKMYSLGFFRETSLKKNIVEGAIHSYYSYNLLNQIDGQRDKFDQEFKEELFVKGVFEGIPKILDMKQLLFQHSNEQESSKEKSEKFLIEFLIKEEKNLESIYKKMDCSFSDSLINLTTKLSLITRVGSRNIRKILFSATNYLLRESKRLAINLLEDAIENAENGLILIVDVSKSTDLFKKELGKTKIAKSNVSLYHIFDHLGELISLIKKTKFWKVGGDTFIFFTPLTQEKNKGNIVLDIIATVKRGLTEIRQSSNISFKGGAHYGKLIVLGGSIFTNDDIIKATRIQQFCKKENEIFLSRNVKDLIPQELLKNKKLKFKPAPILVEGKPSIWVTPEETKLQIDNEEIELYVLTEEVNNN